MLSSGTYIYRVNFFPCGASTKPTKQRLITFPEFSVLRRDARLDVHLLGEVSGFDSDLNSVLHETRRPEVLSRDLDSCLEQLDTKHFWSRDRLEICQVILVS